MLGRGTGRGGNEGELGGDDGEEEEEEGTNEGQGKLGRPRRGSLVGVECSKSALVRSSGCSTRTPNSSTAFAISLQIDFGRPSRLHKSPPS